MRRIASAVSDLRPERLSSLHLPGHLHVSHLFSAQSPTAAAGGHQSEDSQSQFSREAFESGVFQTLGVTSPSSVQRPGQDRVIRCQVTDDLLLFGVVDGHGADALCAEYLADAFPIVIQLLLNARRAPLDALQQAFQVCAQEWDKSPAGHHHQHQHQHQVERLRCGAVALLCLVETSSRTCYIASAGDCQAATSTKTGSIRAVNAMHRTDNQDEVQRILSRGGQIRFVDGVARVQGALVPTRVFGDLILRTDILGVVHDYVAPEPDLFRVQPETVVEPPSHGCSFVVVGTDGLWDALTKQSVASIVNDCLMSSWGAEYSAQMLGAAAMRATTDDVSVIVLVWN